MANMVLIGFFSCISTLCIAPPRLLLRALDLLPGLLLLIHAHHHRLRRLRGGARRTRRCRRSLSAWPSASSTSSRASRSSAFLNLVVLRFMTMSRRGREARRRAPRAAHAQRAESGRQGGAGGAGTAGAAARTPLTPPHPLRRAAAAAASGCLRRSAALPVRSCLWYKSREAAVLHPHDHPAGPLHVRRASSRATHRRGGAAATATRPRTAVCAAGAQRSAISSVSTGSHSLSTFRSLMKRRSSVNAPSGAWSTSEHGRGWGRGGGKRGLRAQEPRGSAKGPPQPPSAPREERPYTLTTLPLPPFSDCACSAQPAGAGALRTRSPHLRPANSEKCENLGGGSRGEGRSWEPPIPLEKLGARQFAEAPAGIQNPQPLPSFRRELVFRVSVHLYLCLCPSGLLPSWLQKSGVFVEVTPTQSHSPCSSPAVSPSLHALWCRFAWLCSFWRKWKPSSP